MNYSTLNVQENNSVRNVNNEQEIPWLGLLIFHIFTINLRNLVKNKLFICKEYHIQPSEIDKMQYWQYEWLTDEIKEITKEQEKENERQQKEQESLKSSMNTNSMMRNIQSSMPSFNMPTVNMPKL